MLLSVVLLLPARTAKPGSLLKSDDDAAELEGSICGVEKSDVCEADDEDETDDDENKLANRELVSEGVCAWEVALLTGVASPPSDTIPHVSAMMSVVASGTS